MHALPETLSFIRKAVTKQVASKITWQTKIRQLNDSVWPGKPEISYRALKLHWYHFSWYFKLL